MKKQHSGRETVISSGAGEACIEHQGALTDGYGVVKRQGKLVRAHRLAYCEANGLKLEDIEGVVIRHTCDNRRCKNPLHLLAGTDADNVADKVARGRQARGERIGIAKLTTPQVVCIKAMLQDGESYKSIASVYGVSLMCISRIRRGLTWGHV